MTTPVQPDHAPGRAPSVSGDTDMRGLYVGVILVELLTLLALWLFQQYFAL